MKFLLPSKIPQFDFQYQLIASQDYWTNFKKSPLEIVYCDGSVNFEEAYKQCGTELHRDENAAVNLKNVALNIFTEGTSGSAVERRNRNHLQ